MKVYSTADLTRALHSGGNTRTLAWLKARGIKPVQVYKSTSYTYRMWSQEVHDLCVKAWKDKEEEKAAKAAEKEAAAQAPAPIPVPQPQAADTYLPVSGAAYNFAEMQVQLNRIESMVATLIRELGATPDFSMNTTASQGAHQ